MNASHLTYEARTVLTVLANQPDCFLSLNHIHGDFYFAALELSKEGFVEFIQYKGFKIRPRGYELIGRGGV